MKLTLITSALVAILACASAQAQTTNAPAMTDSSSTTTSTTSTSMSMKKLTPYKGKITAIDTGANSMTLEGAKGSMTLMINSMTKYKGGSALSDYKVGDMVTGSYMKDDSGMMMAHSVHKKMMK